MKISPNHSRVLGLLALLLLTGSITILISSFTRSAEMPTKSTAVDKAEYDCLRSKFATHYRTENNGTFNSLVSSDQSFSVASFNMAKNALNCATGQTKAFVVNYGLQEGTTFVPEFCFTCLTAIGNEFEYDLESAVFYKEANGELVQSVQTSETWYGNEGPWAQYLAKVWFKPEAESEPQKVSTEEVRYVVQLVSRIESLIAQNSIETGNLKVVSFSEPDEIVGEEELNYRHLVMIAAQNEGEVLIDNTAAPANNPLQNKALDLALPCPKHCLKVSFKDKGVTSSDCP